jgi:hypothetical protein
LFSKGDGMAEIHLSLREANGDLPGVCLVCGRDSELVKKKTFAWQPPWVWVTLLLGVLPFAIIALILTKRATVQAPLCKEHRFHWDGRILGIFFGFCLVAGAVVVAVNFNQYPWLWLMVAAVMFGWIVLAIALGLTMVRPMLITDREIILKAVAPGFVDAMLAADDLERENRYRLPPGMRIVEEPILLTPVDDANIQEKPLPRRPPDDAIRE